MIPPWLEKPGKPARTQKHALELLGGRSSGKGHPTSHHLATLQKIHNGRCFWCGDWVKPSGPSMSPYFLNQQCLMLICAQHSWHGGLKRGWDILWSCQRTKKPWPQSSWRSFGKRKSERHSRVHNCGCQSWCSSVNQDFFDVLEEAAHSCTVWFGPLKVRHVGSFALSVILAVLR